jgi:hypothetical protein
MTLEQGSINLLWEKDSNEAECAAEPYAGEKKRGGGDCLHRIIEITQGYS